MGVELFNLQIDRYYPVDVNNMITVPVLATA